MKLGKIYATILIALLTLQGISQSSCNLDKYPPIQNVKVDSNQTYIYYTNDNTYFIAYVKNGANDPVKYVFDKHLLNFKALFDIAPNHVIVGVPQVEKDQNGKTSYYSTLSGQYTSNMVYTYIIHKVDLIITSRKEFTLLIKVYSHAMANNFEIQYKARKPLKAYKTFADKVNNSEMICIKYAGADM